VKFLFPTLRLFLFLLKAATLYSIVFCTFSCDRISPEPGEVVKPRVEEENKTYLIAAGPHPPYSYPLEENRDYGLYGGFDVDILQAVAADAGFDYVLIPLPFAQALEVLEAGEVDGMIAVMITEERAKKFDFSVPSIDTGVVLAVNIDNQDVFTIFDLIGKRVVVQEESASATVARSLAPAYHFDLVWFEDVKFCEEDVKEEISSAFFNDYRMTAVKDSLFRIIGDVYVPSGNALAVRKDEGTSLLQKYNAGMRNIKINGVWQQIAQNYFSKESLTEKRDLR